MACSSVANKAFAESPPSAPDKASVSSVIFQVPGQSEVESFYVEYKPTGKKLIMSTKSLIRLNDEHLRFLGVNTVKDISGDDFVVNRVLGEDQSRSFDAERRRDIQAWIKGPGKREIVFEPLKVVSTEKKSGSIYFELRTNYILMAQANYSHLAALKLKAKSAAEKLLARKKALELFEETWLNLQSGKFDRSLLGFEALKENSWKFLTTEERQKLVFGLSLSRFHQIGCSSAYGGFKLMLRPGEFQGDATYYAGLCALDANDLKTSRIHFTTLVEQDNPQYVEEARFYLGVVAEAEDDFDSAESAYLDTVDFASKPQLVSLAQNRLALLNAKKARRKYEKKIFSFMLNTGVGYDTNALSLASSIEPSDLSLTTGSSPSYLALAFFDIKNTLFYPIQQKFYYSYLMLGFTNRGIAETTDIQSHDMGANVSWGDPLNTKHTLTLGGSLSYLGKLGSTSTKYLTAYSGKWDLTQYRLNSEKQLDRIWTHEFKFSRSLPATAATSADSDATAWIASGDHKLRYVRGEKGYGYLGGWEYRLATGKENTNITLEFGGHYDQPLLSESFKLSFSQELSLASALYYAGANFRKDYLITSTSSVSRMLASWVESRFQLIYYYNLSNSDNAKYNRLQANFLLTAFF